MKQSLLSAVLLLFIAAALPAAQTPRPPGAAAVEDQIATLYRLLTPPPGTRKGDVDAVYGEPKETKTLAAAGKGSGADFPLHRYGLLPVAGGFLVHLSVTYRDGQVWQAGFYHDCEVNNRNALSEYDQSPEALRQKREVEQERRQALVDLQHIQKQFVGKLKAAPWHQPAVGLGRAANSTQPVPTATNQPAECGTKL